jgi:site-specific recombinase
MSGSWDLTALVNAADPQAGLAERHLWLVRLTEWLRHAPTTALLRTDDSTPLPALRLRPLLRQLDQHPEPAARVRGLADAFWRDIDTPSLLADFGLGAPVLRQRTARTRAGAAAARYAGNARPGHAVQAAVRGR